MELIHAYLWLKIEIVKPQQILKASYLKQRYQISFWDSLIISSAMLGGATHIITEDLSHGQNIEGVFLKNPFLE